LLVSAVIVSSERLVRGEKKGIGGEANEDSGDMDPEFARPTGGAPDPVGTPNGV
jgi:hypothetical protein